MSENNIALSKTNLIICAVAIIIIIVGFLLMVGPATSVESGFEPDIFSVRRIKIAPMITLSGFVLMIFGILFPVKERDRNSK